MNRSIVVYLRWLRPNVTRVAGQIVTRSTIRVVRIRHGSGRRTSGEFIVAVGIAALMHHRVTLSRAFHGSLRHCRARIRSSHRAACVTAVGAPVAIAGPTFVAIPATAAAIRNCYHHHNHRHNYRSRTSRDSPNRKVGRGNSSPCSKPRWLRPQAPKSHVSCSLVILSS